MHHGDIKYEAKNANLADGGGCRPRAREETEQKSVEGMMGRCTDVNWCNMYGDGQMEGKDGVWMQQESNKRGGERGSERGPCQSPVRRVQGLKNVCDIPLLLQRVFQGLLSDIVIPQKALMGLQQYQAPPSEKDRAAVLCWVC